MFLSLLACLAIGATPVLGQRPVHGSILGHVVDAVDNTPLTGARVRLEVDDEGLAEIGVWEPVGGREVITADSGRYEFTDVPAGTYTLTVDRPGYLSRSVHVSVEGAGERRVTLGLELSPIELPELPVRSEAPQPYPRSTAMAADRAGARRAAVLSRRSAYLSSDVRSLTAADVANAVTMGEPDLFRALQRMPGVGRRDDYTAVLWSRGADWSQTRVLFDGLPLFNPTHAGSLFSSVSPNGVGALTFHPGVRSASRGDGAAGLVDLRSRTGGANGPLSGRGELSLVSGQLALDGSVSDVARWMVAGRRTHVDLLARAWTYLNPQSGLSVPYDFSDVTASMALSLGPLTLEASGLNERDLLRGDIQGLLVNNTGRWGNRLGQVTARLTVPALEMSVTRGATRFSTIVDESWRGAAESTDTAEVTLSALENGIDHDVLRFRIASGSAWPQGLRLEAGVEMIDNRVRYDGPFSLLGQGVPGLARDSLAEIPFRLVAGSSYRGYWSEVRWETVPGLELQAGVRVEEGDSVRNGGETRWSPRILGRWSLRPDLSVSVGWNRIYQYIQAIGATGGPLGPQLHLSNLWVLAGRGYPALRSDIATAGVEFWADESWLLTANVYHRVMTGVTEPDPTPGPLRGDRSHVEARSAARGVELSARHLLGPWAAAVGYTLAHAETEADSLRYPSSADIRHNIDASLAYGINEHLQVGAVFSYASGVPFTRVVVADTARVGMPNGQRTPSYASVDLALEYVRPMGSFTLSAYVQLINALNRENRVTYAGTVERCASDGSPPPCAGAIELRDRFKAGLPRLPLVGLRLGF